MKHYANPAVTLMTASLILLVAVLFPPEGWATAGKSQSTSDEQVYIVRFDDPPLALAQSQGVAGPGAASFATASSGKTGKVKLDVNSSAALTYRKNLQSRRNDILARAPRRGGRPWVPERSFDVVLNAMSLRLTVDEAVAFAMLPGVASVEPEEVFKPLTDAGPTWIGANQVWSGAAGVTARGEGVVVGIVDSGINTAHPSFAATAAGYTHVNPRGRVFGLCAGNALAGCNSKLIGLWDFTTGTGDQEPNNGLGVDAHGTHVASTVAGNPVAVGLQTATGTVNRTASGVAPRAALISYKACEEQSDCRGTWILAALEQAVVDGVDVINYSIGSSDAGAWSDYGAMAMLAAREAGIVVAAAAGNDGPGTATLESVASAPWVLTAAASTHDRVLANRVFLSGGGTPAPGNGVLVGAGQTVGTGILPMLRPNPLLCAEGGNVDDTNGLSKPAAWSPNLFSGHIVLCDRGVYPRVAKSRNVGLAGGTGMLLLNQASDGASIVTDAHSIPTSHLTYADSQALLAWLGTGTGHRARIEGQTVVLDPNKADVLASFSSRGPGTETDILKPDLAAPGVNILGADSSGSGFYFSSGTSMASPHLAGAAALIKSARPSWGADQIVSSLMTTAASTVRKEDDLSAAQPFDTGAGRVDVARAVKAALYFSSQAPGPAFQDFRTADPDLNGQPQKINYPSIALPRCNGSCQAVRQVTDLAGGGSWQVMVTPPPGMTVTVTPMQFTLGAGASQTLTVTVTPGASNSQFSWFSGRILLKRTTNDGRSDAAIPLSVRSMPANRAPVPVPDKFNTTPGSAMTVSNPGVLANDLDPDGDRIRFTQYMDTANGTLSEVFSDGEFTYTPNPSFTGVDSFQYEICDDSNACSWGQANIEVLGTAAERYLWYVPRASNTQQQGFVRLINLGAQPGAVQVWGIDAAGRRSTGTLNLSLAANESRQFNSQDLESGNVGKGLFAGIGSGTGDWTLVVSTPLDILAQSLVRTPDGFLTSVHDQAGAQGSAVFVPFFNPADNPNQVSWLRLVNTRASAVSVSIAGRDDAGMPGPGGQVTLNLAANAAIELSAADLESGNTGKGLTGRLGNGNGKWSLIVTSSGPVRALSLLRDPKGFLTNLSGLPNTDGVPAVAGTRKLWLVPRAANIQQQGFVRLVNRSAQTGTVQVWGIDDAGNRSPGTMSLSLAPNESRQFNSQDLESGNTGKGLTGSLGSGNGDWTLVVSTPLDILVQSLIRTPDGFLTSVHDQAGMQGSTTFVPFFNPADNPNQVSWLRLVNPNASAVSITLRGRDDTGTFGSSGQVSLNLAANAAIELSAIDLESGNPSKGLAGRLGDGVGKWNLTVWSSAPIRALSLLRDPNGYLTNLSSLPDTSKP